MIPRIKTWIRKTINEYDSFSVEGRNAIFYQFFITLLACTIMVISCFKQSKNFYWALFFIPISGIIAFVYYNQHLVLISIYIKVNHSEFYNKAPSLNVFMRQRMLWGRRGRFLTIVPIRLIQKSLLKSIKDERMVRMILELKFYRKLLTYCVICFSVCFSILGTLLGLQLNS